MSGPQQLQERHILSMAHAARGLTNREIAEQLGYSPRTIEGLIEEARRALNAKNRAHLIWRAITLGFVEAGNRAALKALSARQLEVATAVAEGLAAPEIAARLGITAPTVSTHLVRAKHATGCRTSAELAALIASQDRAAPEPTRRGSSEPASTRRSSSAPVHTPRPTGPARQSAAESAGGPASLLDIDSKPGLVGRERELTELRHGLASALAGRGRLFMVAGDPGVGKTALADEIGAEAIDGGALVLWGRAWDGGGAPAYWPWLRILRRLGATRDLTPAVNALGPEAAGRLTRLIPALGRSPDHLDAEDAPEPGESDVARFQLFDAVTSLLRSAASQGPLVLILDDLHGADHPSLLLLAFLAVHLRDSPILVIGTYREAEARLDPQLAGTLGDIIRHGQRLPLRGLRERDVAEVVERVAGRRPPDRVVRAIHLATEGNPFFVDEVVRLLSAEGRLDDATQIARTPMPESVRAAIRRRLDPLPDRTRAMLCTAAVIGREFRLDALQRVTELDATELDHALDEAVGSGVIVERPAPLGAYGFSHGLIRETLYDDLAPSRRGQLHRAVGLALEELYVADPDPHVAELAHHFFVAATAGELTKAIAYSVRAGERAMTLVAYEEASDHFERALQAYGLQERADMPRRCDLVLALGRAQTQAGDSHAARKTFLRAAGLARKLESPERLARAALGYGAGLGGFEFGRVDDGLVALLQEARKGLGEQDSPLLARVLGRLGTELYFSDRTAERQELAEQAVAMARRTGDRGTLASTLSARILTLWEPENSVERLQIASDVVALGEEVRDRELVLRGHVWRIVTLMELGDWVGADIELAVHARLADELRDPQHLWYVPMFEAARALLEGRLRDAERFASEAFAVGRGTQPQNAAQIYAGQLFVLRAEQARLAEVEQSLEELGRRYPAVPFWRAAAAFALAIMGRTEEARRAFEALSAGGLAEIPRDGEWLATVALLIRAGARIGDACRTSELGQLLEPYADRAVIAGRGAICLGPVARFTGIAAATAGRFDEAIGHMEHALTMARHWRAEPMIAGIQLDLAAILDRAGGDAANTPRARELRAEGLHSAERLELAGLKQRWTGITPPPPEPSDPTIMPPTSNATLSPTAFYRRDDIWTIGRPGSQIQLRDAKGLTHIARLLAAPHVEFHALDLITGPQPSDAGPILDSQAKSAYRARIAELQEEIDEAESFNDPERAAQAREELAFLARDLAGAAGLHGHDRKTGSDAERARLNVTRAIRTALKRVTDHDPDLGRQLSSAIRTGTFCVYEPPPADEPRWDLTGPT